MKRKTHKLPKVLECRCCLICAQLHLRQNYKTEKKTQSHWCSCLILHLITLQECAHSHHLRMELKFQKPSNMKIKIKNKIK
jgi:hypothetical protein